jgi:hypothetical protein
MISNERMNEIRASVQEHYKQKKTAQGDSGVVNTNPTSFPSNGKMWNQSYSNINSFEGLDKMGTPVGDCPICKNPLTEKDIEECQACTGLNATQAKLACTGCLGSGKLCLCRCGSFALIESHHYPMERWASWQKRADAVKRRVMCGEIPIHIEYDAGDTKTYPDGTSRKYNNHYGFIPGTTGADNEPLDVYLGASPTRKVYVVNQLNSKTGDFDEEKCMLGFPNERSAEAAYRSHYPKNGEDHFGGMRTLGVEDFLAEYVHPEKEDAYQAKIIKNLPLEQVGPSTKAAGHEPGDSDGCSNESPKPEEKKDLSKVDTNPVISPAEEAAKKNPGLVTNLWNDAWSLAGGPKFHAPSVKDGSLRLADMPTGVQPEEQYSQPDQGALAIDDQQTNPTPGLVCVNASFELGINDL